MNRQVNDVMTEMLLYVTLMLGRMLALAGLNVTCNVFMKRGGDLNFDVPLGSAVNTVCVKCTYIQCVSWKKCMCVAKVLDTDQPVFLFKNYDSYYSDYEVH